MYKTTTSLHDYRGQRKYLNHSERLRFLECTRSYPLDIKLFCQLLYYTGARIAEIHNLTVDSIDFSNEAVILESLKKRKKGVYREIPLPIHLLQDLKSHIHYLNNKNETLFLWRFSLRTASRYIKRVMLDAKVIGAQSCARGLRHGFAVHAVSRVPLTIVKKWLGHATLQTTEIYLNVIGIEEREFAKRMW